MTRTTDPAERAPDTLGTTSLEGGTAGVLAVVVVVVVPGPVAVHATEAP
jgi:hypothetical protein